MSYRFRPPRTDHHDYNKPNPRTKRQQPQQSPVEPREERKDGAMRCLSLTQPWATLVAVGAKRIETRSWTTPYRGPLAIHASKGFPTWAREMCEAWPFDEALAAAGITSWKDLPTGVIVATCTLIGCVPTGRIQERTGGVWPRFPLTEQEMAFGDYTSGRWAWLLDDVRPLVTPIPAKGSLGLWECPLEVMA